MIDLAVIQNVPLNHHHAVYIDGFIRELDNRRFLPHVYLQESDEPRQFRDINYKIKFIPGATYSPIGQLQFITGAWKNLANTKHDIIHAMNPFSSVIASLFMRRLLTQTTSQIIYDIRGLWVEFGLQAGYFPKPLGVLLNSIDVAIMKRCDAIIAISPMLKKVLTSKGIPTNKIEVVPGGVDLEIFKNAKPVDFKKDYGMDGMIIGYVASISTARSSQDIIFAFKNLMEKWDQNIYLAMIGPINQPTYFKQLVDDLGLQDVVKFFGFVPHSAIPNFITGFDIAVSYFPEKNLDTVNVRVPYKVLEYLAAGVRTIVTDQVCHTSLIEDGFDGLVVDANIESLTEGLLRILEGRYNPEMGKQARTTAERYSFKSIANKLEGIYSKVLLDS